MVGAQPLIRNTVESKYTTCSGWNEKQKSKGIFKVAKVTSVELKIVIDLSWEDGAGNVNR